jgi:hypothetical protein
MWHEHHNICMAEDHYAIGKYEFYSELIYFMRIMFCLTDLPCFVNSPFNVPVLIWNVWQVVSLPTK